MVDSHGVVARTVDAVGSISNIQARHACPADKKIPVADARLASGAGTTGTTRDQAALAHIATVFVKAADASMAHRPVGTEQAVVESARHALLILIRE